MPLTKQHADLLPGARTDPIKCTLHTLLLKVPQLAKATENSSRGTRHHCLDLSLAFHLGAPGVQNLHLQRDPYELTLCDLDAASGRGPLRPLRGWAVWGGRLPLAYSDRNVTSHPHFQCEKSMPLYGYSTFSSRNCTRSSVYNAFLQDLVRMGTARKLQSTRGEIPSCSRNDNPRLC